MIPEWLVIACVFALPACVLGWIAVAPVGPWRSDD